MQNIQLDLSQSKKHHEEALAWLPLGVTGDGRYSRPYPIVFESAHGKWITDVDGNRYLDFHCGFGSVALGYGNESVDTAVRQAMADRGTFVGVPHRYEEHLAGRLCETIDCAEKVALCGGGGSDAIYHAIRIARAATGRRRLGKVEGGYQGWHSDVGVSTNPALEDSSDTGRPQAVPNSAGILPEVTEAVSVLSANDQQALTELFESEGDSLAALILEPVLYSSGCIILDKEYLELARSLCTKHGVVLILDEIMSGFRNGTSGAGSLLGIKADLAAFGKAISNGYVISVLAGKAELIDQLAPLGRVFYSGTFNGHPISVAAAEATLDIFEAEKVPDHLSSLTDRVVTGVNEAIEQTGANAVCQGFGGVWNMYFGAKSVRTFRDFARAKTPETLELNESYRWHLANNGIYMHPRHINRCFISSRHEPEDIDRTVEVIAEFFNENAGRI